MKKKLTGTLSFTFTFLMILMSLAGCVGKDEPRISVSTAAAATDSTGQPATRSESPTTAASTPKFKNLKIGTFPSAVGVPVQYALEKGYFAEEGLDVEIVMFASGVPINEAMAAKQIDVAATGLASVFSLANDVATYIGEGVSAGAMGIYVRPDSEILNHKGEVPEKPEMYGNAETLRGLKVIGPLGTASQFLTMCYIKNFGLLDTDIQQIHMEQAPGLQAFLAGEGDAISTTLPFSYQAEQQGNVMVASWADATGIGMYDGIIARNDILKSRSEEVELFAKAYFRACEELANDTDLRFEFSINWYMSNGREYSDGDMWEEIRQKSFVTPETFHDPNYVYGEGLLEIAKFYILDGKLTQEQIPAILEHLNPSLVNKLYGVDIRIAE